MSDPLNEYKHARLPVPNAYQRWHLYGAGLENVGKLGKPETVALPSPAPDQILVRHDACGICYSDIKIINLGGEHPRLAGRDLAREPVVMGHEVALTVAAVGEHRKDEFMPGQRFIVQADAYYQGRNLAYGYALSGGMSQYGLVGPELLDGDEGCYLLPIADTTNYAEGALVEPWACVEAAYLWKERFEPERSGSRASYFGGRFNYNGNYSGQTNSEWKFDDISFEETPPAEDFEAAAAQLAKNGVAHLNFAEPLSRPVQVDVGRIHYDGHLFVGRTPNSRSDIKGGGVAWFVGAAGPMGQMHVQRALQLPNPPARLVCTDRNAARIAALRDRFLPLAESRGVELLNYNVKEEGPPPFAEIAPNGFDDIVIMVPDVAAIEEAFPLLAENGVLNVFAGLARGTMATLDMSLVATKNVRIVGTSGSTIHDMVTTRDKMENGALDTGASLAAIGGLEAFRDGLEAVKTGRFPGKTVIYPHVADLPLTALPDLQTVRPAVYAKLRDGQFWTDEAENELLREFLTATGAAP